MIYYSVIAVFVGWGGVALYLAQPRYPLIPGAIIVGVVLLHLYDAWVSRTPQRVLQNVRNQAKQLALMDPIAFRQLATIPIKEWKEPGRISTDGETIFIDVSLAKRLSNKELRGVLIHELLHILGVHHLRFGDFHPELWNIATDLVIDREIVRSDRYGKDFILPKSSLFTSSTWSAEDVARAALRGGSKPPEQPKYDWKILQRDIVHDVVVSALQECRVDRHYWLDSLGSKSGCESHTMSLGNPHIEIPIRMSFLEHVR